MPHRSLPCPKLLLVLVDVAVVIVVVVVVTVSSDKTKVKKGRHSHGVRFRFLFMLFNEQQRPESRGPWNSHQFKLSPFKFFFGLDRFKGLIKKVIL